MDYFQYSLMKFQKN